MLLSIMNITAYFCDSMKNFLHHSHPLVLFGRTRYYLAFLFVHYDKFIDPLVIFKEIDLVMALQIKYILDFFDKLNS